MKKTLILMTLAALPLAACGGGSEGGGGDAVAGKAAFTAQGCVVCHGEGGLGDGIGAVALKVKPRNYTLASWQDSVTDADIKGVINGGGAANGLDAAMAAYPQIQGAELDNIVAFIRSLKK
ncbi:MAG: cytochrome c [Planctomycetota bacterium]|nr:cytochrome c [Planctomycetota bacterium]